MLSKPYGQTFSIKEVEALLTPDVKAVFVQATETSTGVRHDVSALAKLVKGTDALLVVDAITGLGTTAFDVDGDGIDVIIGGSQKALMIPPGLAYLAASERAWARMETSTQPRYYFDLRKERKSAAKGESAYTPSVALIAAMGAALDYLEQQGGGDLAKGRDLLVANAELCALCMRTAAEALGLELFSSSHAAAVTAVKAPEGISLQRHGQGLQERVCRSALRRTGRDEGADPAHRPHRLSRLPGLHGHHRRAGAGVGPAQAGELPVWRRSSRRATCLRESPPERRETVKIVVAEKIAGAAMKVLEAIPDSTVITPEQFALDPRLAVSGCRCADRALGGAGRRGADRRRPEMCA